MRTLRIAVDGMTCASCTGRVERVLLAQPGVHAAAANLATRTAQITLVDGRATARSLAAAVTAAGFDASADIAADRGSEARERAALRRDAALAAALTAPVLVLEMGGHLFPSVHHAVAASIGMTASWHVQSALAALVLAGPGRRFFAKGIPSLLRGRPDMDSLVAIGTSAAFLYSLVATYLARLLPDVSRAVYFEAAMVIVVFVLVGRLMEARARGQAGDAIAGLLALRPATARVERDGAVQDIPVGEVALGDRVHLRPGERIAVDGVVVQGRSFVDESMLTGEAAARAKTPGDAVTGGTMNGTGALVVEVTQVGAGTVLARIVALVAEAQGGKLPVQAVVDRVTLWFVPAVLTVALLAAATWLIAGAGLGQAMVAGVAVLIVACPCAMGLATPTSIMVATGRAADLGVLFRRGETLQTLRGMRWIAFDKTGTLTEGQPRLTGITLAPGQDEAAILALIAAAEAGSEHPLARAVLAAARERGLALQAADDFEALPGLGVRAMVGGHRVLVGSAALLDRHAIAPGPLAAAGAAIAGGGATAIYAAVDGTAVAVLGIADPLRAGAAPALTALRARGYRVAMITGDTAATAGVIAARLGIDRVLAGVSPEGKPAALRALGGPAAFVGDGLNDAAALAAADVGIAIGSGTDVAIEAADVVLMSGDPRGVVTALDLSAATMRNIRQNLGWAFGYNVLLIPVAAGVLIPFGGPAMSPMLSAGAMALSSVFVVLNALRLKRAGQGFGKAIA